MHVVFCRTLPPFKGSQPDLPRQRLDVRPNALDRSLSAVKASPPPVLKQSRCSFLPLALSSRNAARPGAVLGRAFVTVIQNSLFHLKDAIAAHSNEIATEK